MTTNSVSSRVRESVVSPIQEIMLKAKGLPGVVSLGWGVPVVGTPLHVQEAVGKALRDVPSLGQYSPLKGLPELQECIAAKLEQEEGNHINPRQEIIVTVGAMQALFISLLSIVNPGDEVILPTPGFGPHTEQVRFASGTPVYTRLLEGAGWKLDIENIKTLITARTKAMILTHPLNPTGSVFSQDELYAVADLACRHNFYLIIDKTYHSLIYDECQPFNFLSVSALRNRLLQCYSFSKEYALTGWRVGYLHAPADLIQHITKAHDASVVSAPRISQVAALAVLQGPPEYAQMLKADFEQKRNVMCERLDRLPSLFDYHRPAGAFYVFPRIKSSRINASQFSEKLFTEARVVVIPGHAFGPHCTQHIRLCFCVEREEMHESFDRLERFIALNNLMD